MIGGDQLCWGEHAELAERLRSDFVGFRVVRLPVVLGHFEKLARPAFDFGFQHQCIALIAGYFAWLSDLMSADCVGRHDSGQLQQCLPSKGMAFHCQYTTLIVSQQGTLLPEYLQQRLNLVVLERDDLLLAFVGPASEGGQQNVAGLEQEWHGTSGRAQEKRPDSEAKCVASGG